MLNLNMTSYGNILVRGVNWIGDAVMTMPALSALRKAMPESRISLLVKPWVCQLFENDPNIDVIIPYGEEYKGIRGKYRLSRKLKERCFSSAILLQNAFSAAFIAYLAGIPERIGYSRDGRGFLLTMPVAFTNEDRRMHHINYYLELLKRAGIKADFKEPWLYLTLSERLWARQTLKDMKRPILGINPGATYGSSKRWQTERFADVIRRFIRECSGSAVIFGSKSETEIADEIIGMLGAKGSVTQGSVTPPVSSMAGKTTLMELISLISEVDVLLTNDSGPMHIGYAVKTPLAAVFGSTDPLLTGPPGKGNIVLKNNINCSPCFQRECKEGSMRCMDSIGVDEVFDALKKLIPENRAVFFDRDGTLCEDANYLNNWDDFKMLPDVTEVKRLKQHGFKLIGVSNQSGIARGIVDEGFTEEVNQVFIKQFGFDDFYYCPHHPDEHCPCRKPEPEMPLRARLEHGIDLKHSYMVGDKEADMLTARAIGANAILVLTGQCRGSDNADCTVRNLKEAVDWILKRGL